MNNDLLKLIDEILLEIQNNGYISVSKDNTKEYIDAINRMQGYKLIEEFNKSDWRLTENGNKTISYGGIKKYLDREEFNNVNIGNISIIQGNENKVNQQNSYDSKKNSLLEKFSWVAGIGSFLYILYQLFFNK